MSMSNVEDAKSTSKLESLTREELTKFIKKQMLTNQRFKAKCEELTKENESLKIKIDDNTKCMNSGDMISGATHQSLVEEINTVVQKNKILENQLSLMASARDNLMEEMNILRNADAKHLVDLEDEKCSKSQLEEKLLEWEKMMKMLEKERNDAKHHLDNVHRSYQINADIVEDIIRNVESVTSDLDTVSEISFSNHRKYTWHNHTVDGEEQVDVHSECIQMEQNLVKRLDYLSSITASLVFERDEIKEKIQHIISKIVRPEPLRTHRSEIEDKLLMFESSASLLETLSKIEASMEELKNHSLEANRLNSVNENLGEFDNIIHSNHGNESDADACLPYTEHVQEEIKQKINPSFKCLTVICETLSDSEIIDGNESQTTELESSETSLKSTRLELECLKHELEATKLELSSTTTKLEAAKSEFNSKEAGLNSINDEMKSLKIELESIQLRIIDLKNNKDVTKSDKEGSKDVEAEMKLASTMSNTELGLPQANKTASTEKQDKVTKSRFDSEFSCQAIKMEHDNLQMIMKEESKEMLKQMELKERHLSDIGGDIEISKIQNDDEISNLNLQLREKEKREMKMKQLILKNRKEIADLRSELEAAFRELNLLRLETLNKKASDQKLSFLYQNLQAEYEKIESRFDVEKSANCDHQKLIGQLSSELCQAKIKSAEDTEEINKLRGELQRRERMEQILEEAKMQTEKEIQAGKIQQDVIYREKILLESRVIHLEGQLKQAHEEHHLQLMKLEQEIKMKTDELDSVRKDAQHSQLMNLEIADYERSVKSLNLALEEKEVKLKLFQEELQHAKQQKHATEKLLEASENQFRQSEEQCSKLKQMLLKSKKDLTDVRKQESDRANSESQLRTQNEMLVQLTEEQKLKIAELNSESRQLFERLAVTLESHQRSTSLMEAKLYNQQREMDLNKLALENLQIDYDSYKARVHSVLKVKKSNDFDKSAFEDERKEKEVLEKTNKQLKAEIVDLSGQLSCAMAENEQLRDEHDKMMKKLALMKDDYDAAEAAWKEKLEKHTLNHSDELARQSDTIQELMKQNEIVAQTFKEQHARVVESLRNQLDRAQSEVDNCRTRLQNLNPSPASISKSQSPSSTINTTLIPLDGTPEERQAAEGSEYSDDVHHSMKMIGCSPGPLQSSLYKSTFIPLEVLLSGHSNIPSESDEHFSKDEKEDKSLSSSLQASQRQGVHLRQLLNESEATVLRLTEQASILKAEIRRLERNQERQSSVSNMEYLKNIVYKFMTLKNAEERLQLVPVMQTMLKFSPEEKERICSIANGDESNRIEPPGWGSYMKWFDVMTPPKL